ncbi:MAG: SNF2-related protein [Burkholderiales bacterium]
MTDADFLIATEGWTDEKGRQCDVRGAPDAIVFVRGEAALLAPAVWELADRMARFLDRPPEERDDLSQRREWGALRQLALDAGARLDSFLSRTIVLTPERLKIDLRRGEGTGTRVIEVIPSFEGRPDQWLEAFDRMPGVPGRYDIPTPDGIVQVIVTPAVRTVLQQVKRMPGRRVAGTRAEAFITNPFAALGEAASEVIDPDQFEQARADADLLFERFTAHVKPDAFGYPEEIGILIERADRSGTGATGDLRRLDDDDKLAAFISTVGSSLDAGHQLCLWEGREFELTGDTATELDTLARALEARRKPRILVRYDQVYDLSNYASRIENIGSEKPFYSPFIAKPDSEPWAPESVQIGVWYRDDGGEPIAVPMDRKVFEQFEEKLRAAQEAEKSEFEWSALSKKPISVKDGEHIRNVLKDALSDIDAGTFDNAKATNVRNARPPRRPALLIKANIQSIDYEEARREALQDFDPAPALPSSLRAGTELKEHQLKGVAWLQHLMSKCPSYCRGALLADDMGLGKTLQILTMLARAFEDHPSLAPALIIAPVSLLENWKEEVEKFFAPSALPVLTAYGDSLAPLRVSRASVDAQLLQEGLVRFLRPDWRGQAKLVLTTYETLRDLEFSFASERWSVMVCDEAQRIKNPNALVTRAAKKQNVQFKIACTGTPVENTLADLWCLFDFIQPGMLGALNDFARRYRRPIEARTDEEKARVEELRGKIAPQVLRRLKKDVAKDLPQKIVVESCRLPLSPQQRAMYARAIELFKRRGQPGAPFKNALGLLHYLRQLCTDPKRLGLTEFVAEPLPDYRARSPKLDWLIGTLRGIKKRDEKAILFCEFRSVQRMLRHYIEEVFGFAPDIINGDTPASGTHAASRQKRIKAFQQRAGFGVIILSPVAVGFGVNIQGANHVIHFSRTWNPAKEDQATDRAYRIGQTRDVYVYYPVVTAEDFTTFDIRLDQLLEHKRRLAEDMLNGSGDISPNDFDPTDLSPSEAGTVVEEELTLDDVLRMDAKHFEGFVAALWQKKGHHWVQRTPDSHDDGVDVVAITEHEGELVQCKSSTVSEGEVNWDAVKEVVGGEAAYRARFPGVAFGKVCATNQYFNQNAIRHAELNNVELYDQRRLVDLMGKTPVTLLDVERHIYVAWG